MSLHVYIQENMKSMLQSVKSYYSQVDSSIQPGKVYNALVVTTSFCECMVQLCTVGKPNVEIRNPAHPN